MTEKKTNGHDPATAAIVEVLERIEKRLGNVETEARATREELGIMRADVTGIRNELGSLRAETRTELALIHEDLARPKGEIVDITARLAKLEAAVFKPTGS